MERKIYQIPINKPFDYDDPLGKFKKDDVGIYSRHIDTAIKQGAILEITTPEGIAYADPKLIKKSKRYIFRKYKLPEPMLLWIVTPQYGNKENFEKEEVTGYTKEGIEKLVGAWKRFKSSI